MKISVVIPIYNSASFLEKCLNSISVQTFTDFEVLMIDDGSTDDSAIICNSFAKKDKRFIYIYKDNGGSGSARNLGIKKAEGSYIAFIDSDDYIAKDYLETLYAPIKEKPYILVQSGMFLSNGQQIIRTIDCSEAVFTDEQFRFFVLSRQVPIFLFQTTVAKLYSHSFLVDAAVNFREDLSISQDCVFNEDVLEEMRESATICYISYSGYYYRKDNACSSTTRKKTFPIIHQGITANILTLQARKRLIEAYHLETKPEIAIAWKQANAIVWLSNAKCIEESDISSEEKKKLYELYINVFNCDITEVLKEYAHSEQKILKYTMKKQPEKIKYIYKIRLIKKRIHGMIGK